MTIVKNSHGRQEAVELAARIRKYWLERGWRVETEILTTGGERSVWEVRTDMRNGLPRGYKA